MKIANTVYYKGRDGYQAETLTETDANGKVWSITTYKGRGNVYCSAKQGEDNGGGAICYNLSNMMGGDNETYFRSLASEDGQCNEARVRRVHEAGLKAFFERIAAQPEAAKPYIIEVGQIIFDSSERRTTRVIYAVTKPGHFKAVDLDGTRTENVSMLQKGDYTEGNLMPLEMVNELVNKAHTAERERSEAEEKRKAQQAAERAQKIQEGAKIISAIPEGVKAVIIAELHQNESDSQTDYFAHSTKEVVYLAWSTHTKDIFSEMRKAADKFEHTKHLGTGKGIFIVREYSANEYRTGKNETFGTLTEAQEFKNIQELPETWVIEEQEIEHREKWSMGSGYYLKDGHSHASAWAVSKDSLGQYGPTLEALQIAAAEGRFLCNEATPATEAEPAQHEAQEVTAGTVQIVDYSPKAIAVIGDTKPIKDKLKALGGKFNFRLTCGAGWIFPKSRLEEITKALSRPAPAQDLPEIPTAEEIEENNAEFEYEENREREFKRQEAEREQAEYREEQTAQSLATAANYDTDEDFKPVRKQEFCTPKPATGNGFFRESGPRPAAKVTPQVPAAWSRHGAEQESSALKLYSEHQQGQNTGRAQQGFLF